MSSVQRLQRIELVCSNPERLAGFYEAAFGVVKMGEFAVGDPALADLSGIPDARVNGVTLRLARQEINLIAIDPPGRLCPPDIAGWNPLFQHIAVVVADMTSAFARLCAVAGWTAISTGGPQLLPSSSGGVNAFKFRDPEGHPLELIAFPQGAVPAQWQQASGGKYLGIDHSAISVSDTAESIAFYRELGLKRGGGSYNRGPEQSKLDDVPNAVVEVTSLALPSGSTPHVELLCYRGDFGRRANRQAANDVTATRLVFEVEDAEQLAVLCARLPKAQSSGPVRFADGRSRAMLRDPDGHLICLETPGSPMRQPPVAKPG